MFTKANFGIGLRPELGFLSFFLAFKVFARQRHRGFDGFARPRGFNGFAQIHNAFFTQIFV
jgi:hypothetical protein